MLSQTMVVQPGRLQGEVTAPPSKSVMQRICVAVWIRGGKARIVNPGDSADDRVVIDLMKSAGCSISTDDTGAMLIDAVKASSHTLATAFFGESGLAARMCIPVLALAGHDVRLEADESLCRRPMQFFEEVLPQLGVSVSMQDGHLPARIAGRMTPREITVDGAVSSQFITGLLLAYAGAGAKETSISVNNPVSTPYIQLTLDVMKAAGLKVPKQIGNSFHFDNGGAATGSGQTVDFRVEGDWSAAAFWLVAGAISGQICVRGLDVFSGQADRAVLSALMDSGARLSIESEQITVSPAPLKAFHFNATDCPDLFPPLAVLASCARGTSVIEGIGRLKHKESDRAQAIRKELGRMGADISFQDDYMIIRGVGRLNGGGISSHNDHRIAMMCAIAGVAADAAVSIEGAEAVSKSYPRFFQHLQQLGGRVAPAE